MVSVVIKRHCLTRDDDMWGRTDGTRSRIRKDGRAVSMMVSIISIITVIAVLEVVIYVGAASIFGGGTTVPVGTIDLESSEADGEITVTIGSLSIAPEFTDLEVNICDSSGREMSEGFEVQITHHDMDHNGVASEGDTFTITREGAGFVEHSKYTVYLIYTPTGDEIDTASVTI